MSAGRDREALEIADCTSRAAASMFRSRANSRVIEVVLRALEELTLSSPGIAVNSFSSGVATEDAIVSGLAPGSAAVTCMVGKSTFGRASTASDA